MPCKISVPISTKMTYPGHKTSLRRSQSLSMRPKLSSSEGGRSDTLADVSRARRLSISEEATQFYVLQPRPVLHKGLDRVHYPQPLLPRRETTSHGHADMVDGIKLTKHKPDINSLQLSPKSILKNFTAASYRNPVLVTRSDDEEEVAKPSCLRSRDTKGKQSHCNFRYRLNFNPPHSASDKRVTFDEQVSYINDNSLYRRRHSTPSLPLL